MIFYFYLALNLSILFPGIVGLLRFRKIAERYYPFLYLIWIGCINEGISTYLIFNSENTITNNNIYVLVESLLIVWLFQNNGVIRTPNLSRALQFLFLLSWVADSLIIGSIEQVSNYFRIFFSFITVLLAVNCINRNIFAPNTRTLKDPMVLISAGLIIYFTYKILIQAFAIYGFSKQSPFLQNIYIIMYYINFLTNIIFAIAIIWMPSKIKYSLPLLSRSF